MNLMKKWLKEEEGFQVFEKFGLTQGGVLLALGVAAVCVVVMNNYWGEVGGQYFSSDTGIDGFVDPSNAEMMNWGTSTTGQTGWQ
ncbi:hypothetical protein [Bacillus piscicola]|uniref:hypothetical protein n=1 Tax=Bacillus piscicola TaxID=1632684 RepID=UPI001F099B52|nr:hypothetical protein [Bacillus piscicola]